MQFWRRLGVLLLLTVGVARADTVGDLVRSHIEAIGGRQRIAAVKTMRAIGHVNSGERVLRFELLAQRPKSVRVTTTADGQTLIQGSDGLVAWRLEPEKSPMARPQTGMEAIDFMADAEFDDQLIDAKQRGYGLDYAGEVQYLGRAAHKILVTTLRQKPYFLLLDVETYFIVARLTTRETIDGRKVQMETRYDDFSPLDGVLLPRRIGIYADGKLMHETILETMQSNPVIDPGIFLMPWSTHAR